MHLGRSRCSRTILAVLLLLAMQLAFASELCAGIMNGGSAHDAGMQSVLAHAGASDASSDMRACCPPDASPARACISGLTHGAIDVLAAGDAFMLALPAPGPGLTAAAIPSPASTTSHPASRGPPLPAYIVFRRFLS